MLVYPKDYASAKEELHQTMDQLVQKGYTVSKVETPIIDDLSIDKFTISNTKHPTNRVVFTIGLHGIEGYVGHASFMAFITSMLPHLKDNTEVVLYHPLNPYGMAHYRRVNENNVDLNRNFSSNNFTSKNTGYKDALFFFQPNVYRSKFHANRTFYRDIMKLITIHGVKTMKAATLKGQHILPTGLYYSGQSYQTTTSYVMREIPSLLSDVEQVIWFDVHTGYGPRYQMSIVNSKYEKEQTSTLKKHLKYSRILGLYEDDFYEVDGDMIEMIYHIHKETNATSMLYATCLEFGTLGDSLWKTIDSLKAMIFENASCHRDQDGSFDVFAHQLMLEQFLPSSDDWRHKAKTDFLHATSEILSFYNLLEK